MCNLFDTIYSRYNLWMLLPQTYTALKRDLGDATVHIIGGDTTNNISYSR